MDALSALCDLEVPEPLPSSEYRYAIFDEEESRDSEPDEEKPA